jgi:hypothetical protein
MMIKTANVLFAIKDIMFRKKLKPAKNQAIFALLAINSATAYLAIIIIDYYQAHVFSLPQMTHLPS